MLGSYDYNQRYDLSKLREIAGKSYSLDEIRDMGCKWLDYRGREIYVLVGKISSIDLMFEEKKDGSWGVTDENWEIIFGEKKGGTNNPDEQHLDVYFERGVEIMED